MSLIKELKKTTTNYKVYTPKHISRMMLAVSLRYYFKNKQNKKEALDNLKIADISCGTGNLLLEAIESLIKLNKIYYGNYDYNENWIEGFDIDKKALEIFQKRAEKIFIKYNILNKKVKLFSQNSLFAKIENRYDILIGNPPYLGEKNNREIFAKIKETKFGRKYYEGRMDYLYFFIEKGIDCLKENGILTYITTNYWLKADCASKLRNKIKSDTSFYFINDYNKSVFKDAIGQHNIVFSLVKSKELKEKAEIVRSNNTKYYLQDNKLYNHNDKILLADESTQEILNKIYKKRTHLLKDLLKINQGIVSGCDKAFVLKEYDEKLKKYLKPFYKNTDVKKYKVNKDNRYWILYLDKNKNPSDEVLEHLSVYNGKLKNRREVRREIINWWELQWPRTEEIFTKPKIVGRQRNRVNDFAFDQGQFYGSADIYYLTGLNESIDLYYILGYLNSKFFYNWFQHNGKMKGDVLELYAMPLCETPIYYPDNEEKIRYISNLVKKQVKEYSEIRQNKIERYWEKELMQ